MPDHPRSDAAAILSEEIARLPEKYRAPVVLCYLEAMSYEAAAASLGVTEDTVRGRLARARERLRGALTRRGVEVPAILDGRRPAIAGGGRPDPDWCRRRPGPRSASRRAGRRALGAISRSVISLCERTCRTMMLTKLKAAAAALVLGVVAAGAVVSAQQPAGGRGEPSDPATKTRRPPQAVPAKGGNLIVDWIPADGQGGKKEITVDPKRHCIHLPRADEPEAGRSPERRGRPPRPGARQDLHGDRLRRGVHERTDGPDADPFPGVVVLYRTDEEDCYAERQIVLAPGKSITFRSPWHIDPKATST